MEVEEGLDHVDLAITQIEMGLDLLLELLELLPLKLLIVKEKIPGKKPKFVLGNSLKKYFVVAITQTILAHSECPKKTSTTPFVVLIPMLSITSSSRNNPTIQLLSTSP